MLKKFWYCFGIVGLCGAAQVACEDNPDQFYKKAPAGAEGKWNNGGSAPVYDPDAKNGLGDNFNNTSTDELCAGPVKHNRWAGMVKRDIKPIYDMGGIDLRGGVEWPGLTYKAAQKALCQGVPDATADDHLVAHWGDNSEVVVRYLISNNIIDEIDLNPGYEGTLKFESRSDEDSQLKFGHPNKFGAGHKYEVKIGQTVKKDGQDFVLDWSGKKLVAWATELYDALMWTYAPDLPSSQDDCKTSQLCRAVGDNGDGTAGFGARPLGIYFVTPTGTSQPLASQPNLIYAFPVKIMPFSISTMFLKLDREGPTAKSTNLGSKQANCLQTLGMKYSNFLDGCVNIWTDEGENKKLRTKLLGGYAHTKEVYNFSVQGIDTDFASSIVGEDKVILDDWTPSPTDSVYHFNVDIRAKGPLINDVAPDNILKPTLAGTGAILREYHQRVQEDIVAQMKAWRLRGAADPNNPDEAHQFKEHKIGDPNCGLAPNHTDPTKPGFDNPLTWGPGKRTKAGIGGPEKDCTGFENMVTPANPLTAGVDEGLKRTSLGVTARGLGYVTLLVPGDPNAVFCTDIPPPGPGKNTGEACTTDDECNAKSCVDNFCDPTTNYFSHCGSDLDLGGKEPTGLTDRILTASFNQVRNYLTTNGDITQLPPQLRDRKYYFTQLGYAMTKYLLAAGNTPPPENLRALGPTDCSGMSCEPDPDRLQFDQVGNSADQAILRYVDRRFVDEGVEPTEFEYQISVASGNQTETRFRRLLERDEKAVLKAMSEDRTRPLGNPTDNIRLTNILGNPLVAKVWGGAGYDKDHDAYYCVTHLDAAGAPDPKCKKGPPKVSSTGKYDLDDGGELLLNDYKGAFYETPFKIGSNYLKFVKEEALIRSARVGVPIWDNPYEPDGTTPTAAGPKLQVVLPDWRPLAPGAGFAIPINGERERFYPSPQVDFTGQNIEMKLNYELQADQTMKVMSVESAAFEGQLFLCVDPQTEDVLHVRQYDSIDEIMNWLAAHPGAQDVCQIIVKFNPANLGPIAVTSKSAGVQLFVGQGVGVGRIVDVMVFDPSLSQ